MEEIKYYVSSDGTSKDVTTLNTQYLINAINKKKNTLFESIEQEDVTKALDQLSILEDEYYKRVEAFRETLKESEVTENE